MTSCFTSSCESFFLAMTGAMADSVFQEYEDMKQAYREKYRGEIYVSEIYLKNDKLMMDGESVTDGEIVFK